MGKEKKALIVTSVATMISQFNMGNIDVLQEGGYKVYVACNFEKYNPCSDEEIKKLKNALKSKGVEIYQVDFSRDIKNIKYHFRAYSQLKKIANKKFDIVHCQSPIGGVLTRLAFKRSRKNGARVIYTAHGFHFYKGAPAHYWLMFYPVEKWLAKYTDTLITINAEDYERAKKKFGKRCHDIQYVPGVGVDEKKFEKKMSAAEKTKLRESLGLKSDDKVLIFTAEISKRKNQMWLLTALKPLFEKNAKVHLLLPGKDSLNGKCQELANKLAIGSQVHFLGFRDDIFKLLQISDVAISSSKQEGLPVNLLEAAFLGIPIVATDCRGNRDVCEMVGGLVSAQSDMVGFYNNVLGLIKKLGIIRNAGITDCTLEKIKEKMKKIYGLYMDDKLSVIIPVYNCEKYIRDCVNSIIKQDYDKKVEIVIVDDGSTDNSSSICDDLADHNSNIKVFHTENGGVSKARNFGFEKASGDYVYFVDADDLLLPNCIEMIKKAFGYDPDVISIGYTRENSNQLNNRLKKEKNTLLVLTKVNRVDLISRCQLWSNVIKKELLKENGLRLNEKLNYAEDMDLTLEIILLANDIMIANGVLYGYRVDSDSATMYISEKRLSDMKYFIDKWSDKMGNISDYDLETEIKDFLAYQLLIYMGMVYILGKYDDVSVRRHLKNRVGILRVCKSTKVKIGYFCYRIFGLKNTAALMGKYLSHKGIVRKEENV